MPCTLCCPQGEDLVWNSPKMRVILVDDAEHPGFTRVIWNAHVAEMTDLPHEDRQRIWKALEIIEAAMRREIQPDKVNLASLGNMVPHVHWHIIPRWKDDSSFPDSIWTAAHGCTPESQRAARAARIPGYRKALFKALSEAFSH